jgi:surfeit locus 1 family protein
MIRLRFRWPVVIVTLLALALFLHLSQWQWHKAEITQAQYEAYEERMAGNPQFVGASLLDPADIQYSPVLVKGEYEPQSQFFLDNQQEKGVAGVHVITPLHITGTDVRILVDRGWVAWADRSSPLPQVKAPKGVTQVQGIAWVPSDKEFFATKDPTTGDQERLRMRVDIKAFARQQSVRVQPFVVLQNQENADDSLIRNWQAPENKSNMHRSYAVQWVLISLALVVGVLWSGWRKKDVSANQ